MQNYQSLKKKSRNNAMHFQPPMCKHWRVAVIKRRVYRTGSASDIIITNQKLCSTYSELALKVYQFLVMLDISRANFFWLKKFARHMSSKFVKWLIEVSENKVVSNLLPTIFLDN